MIWYFIVFIAETCSWGTSLQNISCRWRKFLWALNAIEEYPTAYCGNIKRPTWSLDGIALARAGRSRFRIPAGAIDFYLLLKWSPDRVWGPPKFLFSGYRCPFPWVKRAVCDDHSPPSGAAVKNERTCTSTPPPYTLMTWTRTTLLSLPIWISGYGIIQLFYKARNSDLSRCVKPFRSVFCIKYLGLEKVNFSFAELPRWRHCISMKPCVLKCSYI